MEHLHTRSLIEAIIALIGLWFVLWHIPSFSSSVYITLTGREEALTQMLEYYSVYLTGYALIGILLISFRTRLAIWLVPHDSSTSFQPSAFIGPGTAIVGICFIASGLTVLGESFIVEQSPDKPNPYLLWRGIFACAIGLILFFTSIGIGRLWCLLKGLRRVGV